MNEESNSKENQEDGEKEVKFDMHIHSTASDGAHSPLRLLLEAHRMGLETVSITDHRTVDGY